MTTVGIELITRGEKSLRKVLESIKGQSFKDYVVTCVNSSPSEMTSKLLSEFNVREIKVQPETCILEARYLAHVNCEGEYRFILDSTRPLVPDALHELIHGYSTYKAVCVKEGSLGDGFWVEQAKMIKRYSDMSFEKTVGDNVAYILPRFYISSILDIAFDFLKENMGESIFNKINYGDHHLIYEATELKNGEIALTQEELLNHYEDSTAKIIFQKYLRYGNSQKMLKYIRFESNSKSLFSHLRPFSIRDIWLKIQSSPLIFLRGLAFFIGYIV